MSAAPVDLSWVKPYYQDASRRRTVTGCRDVLSVSKRDLLLFDSVIVTGFERQLATLLDQSPEVVADAEYLAEQLFFRPGPNALSEVVSFTLEMIGGDSRRLPAPLEELFDSSLGALLDVEEGVTWTLQAMSQPAEWLASLVAASLNHMKCRAAPIFDNFPLPTNWWGLSFFTQASLTAETAECDLIEVLTDYIPVPGEDVPLEAILDFSRDQQTRELKQRLLRATARASLDEVTPESFALQLEEALAAYKEQLALLGAKQRGPTTKLVIAATGAVEELLHLRPRKAVEALLEFRTSKLMGREAELKATGRETAFIYKAEKAFPRK